MSVVFGWQSSLPGGSVVPAADIVVIASIVVVVADVVGGNLIDIVNM